MIPKAPPGSQPNTPGMRGTFGSTVFRLQGEIHGNIQGVLERPLKSDRPCFLFTGTNLKPGGAGRVVPVETAGPKLLHHPAYDPASNGIWIVSAGAP